jgi:hypothetical protein
MQRDARRSAEICWATTIRANSWQKTTVGPVMRNMPRSKASATLDNGRGDLSSPAHRRPERVGVFVG